MPLKILPSLVDGIDIHGPGSTAFEEGLSSVLGRAPRELLLPAIPFSVIVENRTDRVVAYLGVRFDMVNPRAQQISVVHYADALRNPAKAELRPGTKRFICAEPEYTALVLRGTVAPRTRGRMNLDNLRRMLQIRASIDCVAFSDGTFLGPDSQKAFERLDQERQAEKELIRELELIHTDGQQEVESLLARAVQDPDRRARRNAARKLLEAYQAGGAAEALIRARSFRHRIPLSRELSPVTNP